MHPVDAAGAAALQKARHRFVGGDHELFDERMRFRLRARAHADDAPVLSQAEFRLESVDGKSAARMAGGAQRRRQRAAACQQILESRCGRLISNAPSLDAPSVEAGPASDDSGSSGSPASLSPAVPSMKSSTSL